MLPVPPTFAAQPQPPQARGKQLRDLTIDALALFKKKKFNPLEELIKCYEEIAELDQDLAGDEPEIRITAKRLKFDVIKEITQYAAPKLRSVEHTGEINTGITVVFSVPPKKVETLEIQQADVLERLPE